MVQVADRGTAGGESGDRWRSHPRRGAKPAKGFCRSKGRNMAGLEWDFMGIMGILWDFMGILWVFHGILWVFYGILLGFYGDFMGILWYFMVVVNPPCSLIIF